MKRKYFVIGLMLVIATTATVAGAVTNLATLEYEENEIIVINGNATLEYDSSDTGEQEVLLIWRIYDLSNNLTLYCIQSQEISYDHTFINDTKNYTFYDNATGKYYVIQVDYSSIVVPESFETILNETIAKKDAEIANLTKEIVEINETLSLVITERDRYKAERDAEIADNVPLRSRIDTLEIDVYYWRNKSSNLSSQNNDLEHEINELNDTISYKNDVIAGLKDMWCLDFKWSSFLIGIVLTGLISGGLIYKIVKKPSKNKKPEFNDLSKGISTKVGKGMPKSFGKKEEKKDTTTQSEKQDTTPAEKIKEETKTEKTPKPDKKVETIHAIIDNFEIEKSEIGVEFV